MLPVYRLPVLPHSFYNALKACRIIPLNHGSVLLVYRISNNPHAYRILQRVVSWFHVATFGLHIMLDTKFN